MTDQISTDANSVQFQRANKKISDSLCWHEEVQIIEHLKPLIDRYTRQKKAQYLFWIKWKTNKTIVARGTEFARECFNSYLHLIRLVMRTYKKTPVYLR